MLTTLSTKGQIVLPRKIRDKMELRPGDQLRADIEGERIVLTPSRRRGRKGRIIKDPLTGFPVLAGDENAPRLTSKQVREILAEFP